MNGEQQKKFNDKRAELEAKRAGIDSKTKAILIKAGFGVKYVYVKSGHIKNEMLGFLTIFNLHRAYGVHIKRHIHYAADNDALYLNVYRPKRVPKDRKMPVFIYIHGGGWIGGIPENREAFTTQLAAAGYFVASVFYGHAPFYAHPKPVINIYKAFKYLREHADELNIDMSSVVIGGESAGAHLSAMVGAIATNPQYRAQFDLPADIADQKIKGLMLNCGVYDMKKVITTGFKYIHIYTACYCGKPVSDLTEAECKDVSPIFWVNEDFPPSYLVSAEHDRLAVLTFDMIEKLSEKNVKFEHYHGDGRFAVHAFAVAQVLKISQEVMDGVLKFLRELN